MADKLEGLTQLRERFDRVSKDMELRVARAMVVSAGGILKKEAKHLAQSQGLRLTGAMINNIAIKREKTPSGVAQYNLGVRHGRHITKAGEKKLLLKVGKSGRIVRANDPWYWFLLEFGRNTYQGGGRSYKSSLKGRVEPTPFIAPALENRQTEAIQAMEDRLSKELAKANR